MTKKTLTVLLVLLCILTFSLAGCGSQQHYIDEVSEDLSSYEITASFDATDKTLEANQKVIYKNNTGTQLDEVKFHLYPNAFREDAVYKAVADKDVTNAYPSGKSYGGIEIESVKVDGQTAVVNVGGQDKNILTVALGESLAQGDDVVIEVEFVDLLPKVAHRYGYTDNNYSFGNWYPVACAYENGWITDTYCTNGDPFCSDMANYDVKVSYPKGLVVAATGNFDVTTIGDKVTMTSSAKTVRDFAFVLSDKMQSLYATVGETTVRYFWFDDANAEDNLQVAIDAVKTFNETIGVYPYDSLCVVQTDFLYGGMEYPNLVYIASNLDATSHKQVIVHEIAHQWWYNLVGNNQVANAWMDEGLTEFSTALFFKKNQQYKDELTYDKLIKMAELNYTMFVDVLDSFSGGADTSMTRASNEYKTEQEYVCMTYTKGMLLFDNLMFGMGQGKMEKCLKQYFEDNKCTRAKPADMIASFEKASSNDLDDFFDSWLDGKVVIGS